MAVAEPGNFFKQKRNASDIKAEILLPFFTFWATNSLKEPQTAKPFLYLDLQAGTGYSPEEQPASPLLILSTMAESTGSAFDLNAAIQTCFYDSSEILTRKLQENINNLPYFQSLVNRPVVLQDPEVQAALLEQVKQAHPALLVLDPFSGRYAGKVLAAAGAGAEADIFMLFSYSKMRQAVLATATPDEEISAFFGERLNKIRYKVNLEKKAKKQEQLLLQEFEGMFKIRGFFTFTFKINLPGKDQTSHYLILASKQVDSYIALKEILYPYSEVQEDGVPLFISSQKERPPLLPGFFCFLNEFCLENLINDLAQKKSRFHYQTIQDIFKEHSIGTNYIKKNYLRAFSKLREVGTVDLVDIKNKKVQRITDDTVVFYKLHGSKR